jgi:CheY-like chemotaxis protein
MEQADGRGDTRNVRDLRVLVADDDRLVRQLVSWVAQDAGYDVVEAADGAAALHVLRTSNRRLVALIDGRMPKLSGIEVIRQVAADPLLAHKHACILMTGDGPAATRASLPHDALAMLAVPIIAKPFDLDILIQTLATAAESVLARAS